MEKHSGGPMGVNFMLREVNREARHFLARRITNISGDYTIHIHEPESPLGKNKPESIIFLFGPHKTNLDSALMAYLVENTCPERAMTLLARPAHGIHSTFLARATGTVKQALNPLSHPVYTLHDTSAREIAQKNEDTFQSLARLHTRIKPSAIFLAPDGGASEGDLLDERRVRLGGLMGIYTYLNIHMQGGYVAIRPVGIWWKDRSIRLRIGDDLAPIIEGYVEQLRRLPRDSVAKDAETQVKQMITASINNLVTA